MKKFRDWFKQHLTQADIEEVTARDVGQTWAYLVKMVKEIRKVLRPIRWVVFVLVILVIGVGWRVEAAHDASDRATVASNRAAAASDRAAAASADAKLAASETQRILNEAIALVNSSRNPNQATTDARAQIAEIHDRCVVRKEC